MNVGGTKMEAPRQFMQEGLTQPAATSTNICNIPLGSNRPPDMDSSAPNSLSYWPSAGPALPSNAPVHDDPRGDPPGADSPNAVERDSAPAANAPTTKPCDVGHTAPPPAATTHPQILHHNLPPIAGITSSHNYRGVREAHKQSQATAADESKPDKPEENNESKNEYVRGSETDAKTDSEKTKPDDGDCEIVEVPTVPSTDRPKSATSEYVFSIPTAINSAPQPKPLTSPRAPTPFVSSPAPAPAPAPAHDTLSLNITSCSSLSAGSPSPSSRPLPSPHFVAPSPTIQCPSPSESPRTLPSSLPSPSSLHRALSSSHLKMPSPADGTHVPGSPQSGGNPQSNPPSPSPRSMPFFPNSHSNHYMNAPRNAFNSAVQNFHGGQEPVPRVSLPQATLPVEPQRIHQPAENQVCRNPFELPITKPYVQYHPEQHHQQQSQQQQQQSIGHQPSSIRPVEPHTKMEQYLPRDQHRVPGFYPQGLKPLSGKETERLCDMKFKQINSQATAFGKAAHTDQVEGVMQRRTPNALRNDFQQRNFLKQPDPVATKANGPAAVVWTKPEVQSVNKNYGKVNGNEFSNRKIPEVSYHSPVKHPPEGGSPFTGRFDNKQNGNFNQMNSLSQRFPPVPQSNYDLNRHIYDSMTGGGRTAQPQTVRLPEKSSAQFASTIMTANNPQQCKNQPYYRDLPEQDKTKTYMQPLQVKGNEYPGQGRPAPGSYGQFNDLLEKASQDAFPNKRPAGIQASVSTAYPCQPQTNDQRHSLAVPDHHRPVNQGFSNRMSAPPHVSQAQNPTVTDRNRPVVAQQTFSQKCQQQLPEYDAKKMTEAKSSAPSQFSSSQPMATPVQTKPRTPSSTATVPVRSKRESPLDLSVKTVRQSADSTAKDDGDIYLQNFKNFFQGPTPGQPPRYPLSQASEGATGAPKIDFTPNFSGFHTDTPATTSHHKQEVSSLPPVESFKKFPTRLPAPVAQDTKNKNSFNSPKYFPTSAAPTQKSQGPTPDPTVRYPDHHFRADAQKRPAEDALRNHSSQAKIPKLDPWKLAFDQQIEQRLNSARINHQNNQNAERAVNGVDAAKPPASQYPTPYHRHSGNHYRGANMYPQPPVQSSATPYNPSYVQQPQCQPATPQTPQEKLQHRENVGHSPDPEQIIKQISKGVMPDHKLLQDKNVLSILRSSLEEKEAKLMQLREVAKRKEKYKELMSSDLAKNQFQLPKPQQQPRQALPSFGALALERMCAPPSFPGHRLNLPRPIDAVKIDIEPTQKYFSPAVKNDEKSGIPSADLSPHDDAQGPPTDLDGLAAFLAARIRTKGELKQVGPALNPGRPGLHQLKPHCGPNSEVFGHASTAFQPNGSPPKLVRESRLLPPLRRRYFSHTEDETPTTSGAHSEEQQPLPPRDPNGIRSSSETSVFDFRESDSEGEMPVLERQTLEGMRRDRKTFGSKQNVSTTTPDDAVEDKPEVIAELDKSHPDPFWDTAFDMFVEQLEKRPPKRSVRKKKVVGRTPSSEGFADDCETRVKAESNEKSLEVANEDKRDEMSAVKVKDEPEDPDKVEGVPDGHVKLSSSRLKVYRDEMRLMEEKEAEEEEREKETKEVEKEEGAKEKDREEEGEEEEEEDDDDEEEEEKDERSETEREKARGRGKKEGGGVRTRGRSKVPQKMECSILDFESDFERETRSDSESTLDDDDDSLSLSGLESESSESESSDDSSNSNYRSEDDSEEETVARKKRRVQTRLQTRSTRQRQVRGTGMKLRSKVTPLPKATAKPVKKKRKKRKEEYYPSGKRKKPSFGDGSDFRPGWEEECYKFKQQLRMPEKLISISRPPKRSSASLPDLDPYRNSPSLDSSDVSVTKKSESGKADRETDDSDADSGKQKPKPDANISSLLKSRNGKKSSQSGSLINMLVDKYGKGNLKKQKDLKAMNERKSPRVLPKATSKAELLPTPGLGKENVLKRRGREPGKKKLEDGDAVYLGYFRRKTVSNFKDAFKQKVGLLQQEFSPVVLKSRTRTQAQTRDLRKRATLLEVFGDERPASAPPLGREEDTSTDQEKTDRSTEKRKPRVMKKVCGGVVTRGRGKLTRSGRPGLRSTAVLRSNKAVQISKRHLNGGRKRNMELLRIRAMASKKFSYLSGDSGAQLPMSKKRLKLKSVRRKFRSGFDYIRKKKKLKKDGDSADGSVKEKRLAVRPTSESVEDVQNEIKNWVINKGLGETILHRAARLGYTDVAAYCLEKMDCSPSPRDNAGYTPLHEACSRGHLDIAKLLLMYGASVSESAKGGIRPLHEAAENGFTELIRLLLSYGADPLLETYTGHTALSLVTDEEARRLIQHHLADVQGNVAPVWTFQGPASLYDPSESGYDPLCDPPSPSSVHSDYELEASETMLPPLYRLSSDREPDRRWVLLRDILLHTKAKSKEVILKQLGSPTVREMKLTEFQEQSKPCSLLGLGERPPTKASKVVLLLYDDDMRQLLGVEKAVV